MTKPASDKPSAARTGCGLVMLAVIVWIVILVAQNGKSVEQLSALAPVAQTGPCTSYILECPDMQRLFDAIDYTGPVEHKHDMRFILARYADDCQGFRDVMPDIPVIHMTWQDKASIPSRLRRAYGWTKAVRIEGPSSANPFTVEIGEGGDRPGVAMLTRSARHTCHTILEEPDFTELDSILSLRN